MADLSITPVATQIRPVQPMTLGDMINMARGIQAYQQTQQLNPIELQTAQQQLSRLQQLTPEEVKRAQAEATVAEKTVQPRVESARSQAATAEATSQGAQLELLRGFLKATREESADLIKDPDLTYDKISSRYKTVISNLGVPTEKKDQILAQGLASIPKNLNSDQYRAMLGNELLKTVQAESRISTLFPSVSLVSTGQALVPVTTGGALAVQQPGQPTGMPGIPMQPPPTTEVVGPTGQRQLLGTITPGQGPIITGLGPQQTAGLTGAGQIAVKDWDTTYNESREAGPRIATFQNIKKLVPESFTGVGSEKKQFVSNLAQAIGIPLNVLESSSTDELAKNTKILQLAGGSTDAARQIAELANPNTKMTKEGILRVTDQLIGIEKLKQSRANFLQPYAADAAQYQQKATQFNQVADPRLFQESTAADVAKMKAAMTPAERAEFGRKVQLARQLGII